MISSPSPSNELIPAAIAVSFLGDGKGDLTGQDGRLEAVAVAFAVAFAVAVVVAVVVAFAVAVVVTVDLRMTGAAVVVVVTMTVAVSVLLGDVEPDVRLKMICPA